MIGPTGEPLYPVARAVMSTRSRSRSQSRDRDVGLAKAGHPHGRGYQAKRIHRQPVRRGRKICGRAPGACLVDAFCHKSFNTPLANARAGAVGRAHPRIERAGPDCPATHRSAQALSPIQRLERVDGQIPIVMPDSRPSRDPRGTSEPRVRIRSSEEARPSPGRSGSGREEPRPGGTRLSECTRADPQRDPKVDRRRSKLRARPSSTEACYSGSGPGPARSREPTVGLSPEKPRRTVRLYKSEDRRPGAPDLAHSRT